MYMRYTVHICLLNSFIKNYLFRKMNNNRDLKIRLVPSLLVFQEVVRWRSYTKAGTVLGLSKSAVSQHVSRLEKALKITLLNRNTRNISVTEAGNALYEKGHVLGEMVAQTLSSSELEHYQVTGRLSVTIPHILETDLLIPVLSQMRDEFPRLTFQVNVSDKQHDLIEKDFDIALTGGYRADSSYKSQKIASIETHCFASPELVHQRNGLKAEDIENVPWVCAEWQKDVLSILSSGIERQITLNKVIETTSMTSAINFATSSMGVVLAADVAVKAELRTGQLVKVFDSAYSKTEPIYFVHAFREEMPIHVKRFRDLVRDQISNL